jgi:8-oxo-dGTP pyrophosphatase MutT (NUDIX family)
VDRVEQAGGIAVRMDGNERLVLLVRAKKDPSVWIFPKGHIEPGETAAEAALRETREEAGVDGELVGPIGAPLEFQSGFEPVRVQYFLIVATSEVDSMEGRAKAWCSFDEAIARLTFEGARQLLALAREATPPPVCGPARPPGSGAGR